MGGYFLVNARDLDEAIAIGPVRFESRAWVPLSFAPCKELAGLPPGLAKPMQPLNVSAEICPPCLESTKESSNEIL